MYYIYVRNSSGDMWRLWYQTSFREDCNEKLGMLKWDKKRSEEDICVYYSGYMKLNWENPYNNDMPQVYL